MAAGVAGPPAGFLARMSALEREVSFLKQKVEDDARWKHVLQNWVLDNFAFDIQGMLLNRHERQAKVNPTSTTTARYPKKTPSKSPMPNRSSSPLKIVKVEPVRTRLRGLEEDEDGSEEPFMPIQEQCDDLSQGYVDENDVDDNDFMITPDICADNVDDDDGSEDVSETQDPTFAPSLRLQTSVRPREKVVLPSDDSGSDSEDFSNHKYTKRKMEWTLISTYPNLEAMQSQFNLRAWGLSTKHVSDKAIKNYYYCKECRKQGPGKLQVTYFSEDTEVEVLKNQLEHDHSKKRFLNDEMKLEIRNLYNAGILDSPKILAAIKVSKPEMRLPTLAQICNVLKPIRKLDRIRKLKEKKRSAKEKEKKKAEKISVKRKKNDEGPASDLSSILPHLPQTSSSSGLIGLTPQQQQHLSQFVSQVGQRDFQQFYQHSSFDPGPGNVQMRQYP